MLRQGSVCCSDVCDASSHFDEAHSVSLPVKGSGDFVMGLDQVWISINVLSANHITNVTDGDASVVFLGSWVDTLTQLASPALVPVPSVLLPIAGLAGMLSSGGDFHEDFALLEGPSHVQLS